MKRSPSEQVRRARRIPLATYRLQFNRDFTFADAAEIADYLRDLGISDCYASPLFQSGADSTHGYDVCCFGRLNPQLGTAVEFEQFTARLKSLGLGLLLDMVPNHMGAALTNAWWIDVLENGPDSEFARYFDINWQPSNPALHNKILLPVLEDHFGKVLIAGKIRVATRDGKLVITYYNREFPVNRHALPPEAARDPDGFAVSLNGRPGDARSFDKLHRLLHRQFYRLAYWKVGAEEINYRRFFDVTELVSLKVEDEEVFNAIHEYVFELWKSGAISGLRIDHPDGLLDPRQYFERLQRKAAEHSAVEPSVPQTSSAAFSVAAKDESSRPLYVVAEKILSTGETLPDDWPVDGTTGYEFLNRVNGLFVNSANAALFDRIYKTFTANGSDYEKIAWESRKKILARSLVSELESLSLKLQSVAARSRSGIDFTLSQLKHGLAEVISNFPVYRTYITEPAIELSASDRAFIETAMVSARARNPGTAPALFDFIERLLTLEMKDELDDEGLAEARNFILRFQQLTGPATAKGLEDTAFYNFNRLISLNEVGGDPGRFGVDPASFHEANIAASERWPHTLLATSTHDTKRGEDARARIDVLSELPDEWEAAIARWSKLNSEFKTTDAKTSAPDANDEYLFYQAAVGSWPVEASKNLNEFRERISGFMLKAVKEAKRHTSWTDPDERYETAVREFVTRALTPGATNRFVEDAAKFARRIAFFGQFNSLAQTLIKITAPGVPDFYQGAEGWNLSFVDPDNRRPANFAALKKALSEVRARFNPEPPDMKSALAELLELDHFARSKLYLIWRALRHRNDHRALFEQGSYTPLPAFGSRKDHVCAFARQAESTISITIAPRLVAGLTGGRELAPIGNELWSDTHLPLPGFNAGDELQNVLTRERLFVVDRAGVPGINLGEALNIFPVALLTGIEGRVNGRQRL